MPHAGRSLLAARSGPPAPTLGAGGGRVRDGTIWAGVTQQEEQLFL